MTSEKTIESDKLNQNKVNTVINIFSFIPLSIVVFGVFTIGFFVAPTLFRNIEPRSLAAEVMTIIFMKFYPFAFSCILITTAMEVVRLLIFRKTILTSKLWLTQFIFIIFVGLLTAYSNLSLAPRINEMRLENTGPTLWNNAEFIVLHKNSEKAGKAMFLFGLIPLCIMVSARKNDKL